ncbi:hypothetical protein DICPUDRAFT_86485 [Dictyostelium purpureum]|uniref:Alpha-galactosidase n=1 Tax=Dictyostelium purpureum TaxID=5786 RepID=F0ZBX2_DICPU|nr:uncharacterized protein DICPUDRAFT_86485 [Dictyostelium purpureum]EGC38562.1 hypothetical protein DICPUDRAFT_86485 [Dictyostelium purpureum]|eukprot:XP_003284933.1 hypothetical protein DICPUDRAFT_86485 [Dictyostelium purpureum]
MLLRLSLIVLAFTGLASAINNGLGLTPQMGWNSWNYYACDINETVIMNTALAMSKNGMAAAGYKYVNIDDCWALERASNGTVIPDPKAFPNGIKYVADYIHSLGLLIGIYTDAGLYTCQKRPGSYGFEEIDAITYAEWGIDYLKEDWCYSFLENPQERYQIMSNSLNATGRQIFFSLCDWGTDNPWTFGGAIANSWRTTPDIKDNWDSMMANLMAQASISSYSGVGGWNDPDMLEVGNGGMTNTEYISHFSLWSILNAPLIAGNNLIDIDQETLSILTATEVIAVNQDPLGVQGALVKSYNGGLQQIWAKPMADGSRAVVLFNTDTNPATITLNWADIWVAPVTQQLVVRDLWQQSNLGTFATTFVSEVIPPHGCVMLKLTPATN